MAPVDSIPTRPHRSKNARDDMNARRWVNARCSLALVVTSSLAALAVNAADPRGGAAARQSGAAAQGVASPGVASQGAASQDAAYARPTNLRVLPKDISAADLKDWMERYDEALGVTCDYCHVQDPQTQRFDYASDDNAKKQTARVMIAMLDDINGKFLSQLGDPRYPVNVSCGNCHQGQSEPPAFDSGPGAALSAR